MAFKNRDLGKELYDIIFQGYPGYKYGNVLVGKDFFEVHFYQDNPGFEVPDTWYDMPVYVRENLGIPKPLEA